jgi:hypothetical protein
MSDESTEVTNGTGNETAAETYERLREQFAQSGASPRPTEGTAEVQDGAREQGASLKPNEGKRATTHFDVAVVSRCPECGIGIGIVDEKAIVAALAHNMIQCECRECGCTVSMGAKPDAIRVDMRKVSQKPIQGVPGGAPMKRTPGGLIVP